MLRIYSKKLDLGLIELDENESHHLASVLRASPGDEVEIFDEIGATAHGKIERISRKQVAVNVERIEPAPVDRSMISVYSAIPKGERADWMIEKLSEVGCDRLILLRTSRSVTAPKGDGKWARWRRIAIESARQCRRVGVMTIHPALVDLKNCSKGTGGVSEIGAKHRSPIRLVASLRSRSRPLIEMHLSRTEHVEIFIGPEGDFSNDEYDGLSASGAIEVALTQAVMRVETAAVVSCSTVSQMLSKDRSG